VLKYAHLYFQAKGKGKRRKKEKAEKAEIIEKPEKKEKGKKGGGKKVMPLIMSYL